MKAQLIGRYIDHHSSITLQNYSSQNFLKIWHYHPELELDVIRTSTGTRFVGDSIEKFEPGDIVLLGKNLPHLWLNDKIYFKPDSRLMAEAVVIHFAEDFGGGLLKIPEMADIHNLFERAKLGIKFMGNANQLIIKKVDTMFELSGYDRIILFIDIIHHLATHNNYQTLSSLGYVNSFKGIHNSRMLPVFKYVMNNFKEEIKLETVSNLANMNASSFSRYFTNFQKKTFTQFLNEIRIGFACKLLIENKCNIASACYESGFNNISNFNKQFKAIKKMTPSKYIRLHTISDYY